MKIVEDITYNLDDIISQIKESFGFIYNETDDHSGYIILDRQATLRLVFNEDETKLDSAIIEVPGEIDLTNSTVSASTLTASVEAATQIVDLIKKMLGGDTDDEDT